METSERKHVVILGGGTAGWMTASYLKAAFADRVEITLIESEKISTVGVGEATFSDIRHFFEFLDIKEREWMPACNATYKLAVRFQNWRRPGHHFYHPFEQVPSVDGFSLMDWWLHNGPTERFDRDCFVIASLCDNSRNPRHMNGALADRDFVETEESDLRRLTMSEHQGKTQFPYAYHFEASLLAQYLAGYSQDRGVRRLADEVVDVDLDERGWISGVVAREYGRVSGDLYVDCTGFRGLLINKALGEPFISFQETLPNDSAVALQVPLDMEKSGIQPCTTATAQDNGWIWTIPLFGRIGTGYVYARDYCEPEEAERTLREFVGPAAADATANHIRMRIGRCRNSWVKNCVAIGLSSGFVEPLESTGIFFIHHAIEQLVKHFPAVRDDEAAKALYNRAIANGIDGVREFLVLHYKAAARNDTQYWKDAKTRVVPDGFAERFEQWQVSLPDSETIYPYYHGLPPYSYNCILLGMGGLPLQSSQALTAAGTASVGKEFQAVRDKAALLVNTLPSQYEYFAQFR